MLVLSSYEERLGLTSVIEEKLKVLFRSPHAIVHEYGLNKIIDADKFFQAHFKSWASNVEDSSMMIRYAPDFLLLKYSEPRKLFFLDVKHSVTPIWFDSKLEQLRFKSGDMTLTRSRIGVIAREALLAYRRYYPNTIILMACPYNKNLLMAQFACKVKCLFCFSSASKSGYDCNKCPDKVGGFFDNSRALFSRGSQTPMTNVDLDSFEPADAFFIQNNIVYNKDKLDELKELIMKDNIKYSNIMDLNNLIKIELRRDGCTWI